MVLADGLAPDARLAGTELTEQRIRSTAMENHTGLAGEWVLRNLSTRQLDGNGVAAGLHGVKLISTATADFASAKSVTRRRTVCPRHIAFAKEILAEHSTVLQGPLLQTLKNMAK